MDAEKSRPSWKSPLYYLLQYLILAYLFVIVVTFAWHGREILAEWGFLEPGNPNPLPMLLLWVVCVGMALFIAWLAEIELSRRFGYRSPGEIEPPPR